ncbi:MAG: hypothetical protein JWO10_1707 [Microbacteriaceae bacterium]|nr:hypothetical protein [Microbacteriaceae bacterium]
MAAAAATTMQVSDRLDILDLYARQCHAIDSGDGAAWAMTFTADASFASGSKGTFLSGRAEFETFVAEFYAQSVRRGEQNRELVTSVVLSPHDSDSVHSEAYVIITASAKEKVRLLRTVRLVDELVRVEGEWLFSSRLAVRDGQ